MNLPRSRSLTAILISALIMPASHLLAQSDNASISGVVKDPTAALVANAAVVLTDERTTLERRTTTSASGYYVFTSIPPGLYAIQVQAPGFKATRQQHNEIVPAMAANINLNLEIGGTSESVSVTASPSAVLPDSGVLSKVIDHDVIDTMALSGRNALYSALLVPGVTGDILNTNNFATGGFTNTSINSATPRTSDVTYDGASAWRTRSGTYSTGSVDADAVQEVQVLTSAYSAEYGRASGGSIRVITKGGSQAFHGNLYEYVENNAFNANDWGRNNSSTTACPYYAPANPNCTNSVPATLRFNQFGWNLGGPVFIPHLWNTGRSKAFFYVGQEYARYRTPATSSMTVPSDAMRTGDFSQLLVANNPFAKAGLAIKDPKTGLPIPGNIIPASQLSQSGLGLLKEYPTIQGNYQAGFNWIGYATNSQKQVKNTFSGDINPKENHMIRFRSNYTKNDQLIPFYAAGDRTPLDRFWRAETASINYIWTLSPTMVNEALIAVSHDTNTNLVDYAVSANRNLYGINYPYFFPGTKAYNDKIPSVTIELLTAMNGLVYPSKSAGPIYKASDNLTKIHGNHTFKVGFSFEHSGENNYDQAPGNQNGNFTFTAARGGAPSSGSAIANAALGIFDTYTEYGAKAYTPYRGSMCEWFAQDGWKVNSKLRVEIGLRHTITQPYYSLWNNYAVFDPSAYNPAKRAVQDPKTGFILGAQTYNGLVIPGDGWPDAAKGRFPLSTSGQYDYLFSKGARGYSDNHSNFQPRAGIAYQLGNGKVIRAGGGRFVLHPYVSDSVQLGGQPPFQPAAQLTNGNVDNPGGSGTHLLYPAPALSVNKQYPMPETYNWNVTFSTRLPFKTILELSYVGSRSLHNIGYRNINQLPVGTTYKNPGINPDYLRPYGGYTQILSEEPSGSSKVNSFQLSYNRRASHGLTYGVAYTRMSAHDDGSYRGSGDNLPSAFDRTALWGTSDFSRPNVLVIHYMYELPFLKSSASLLGKVAGGWSFSGVSQFQSGGWASITTTDDFAGVGPGRDRKSVV